MWYSMFKIPAPKTPNPIEDVVKLVKDILLLINEFYHTPIVDLLIKLMTNIQDNLQENRPSPFF